MVYEFDEIHANCGHLESRLKRLVEHPYTSPRWDALDYSVHGVNVLFDEFKRVAAHSDFFDGQLQPIMAVLAELKDRVRNQESAINAKIDAELTSKAKQWILTGFAQSERQKLAALIVGDDLQALSHVKSFLELLGDLVSVIQGRIKRLEDFKYSARLLKDVLNFAHALQELDK